MAPPAFSDKVRCVCCKVPLPQACCGVGCAAGIFASLTAVAGLAGLATGSSSCIYVQPGDKHGSSSCKVSYTVGYMLQKTNHYLVLALHNVVSLLVALLNVQLRQIGVITNAPNPLRSRGCFLS